MIEMQLKCVFCKRFLNSCLDIHNPTECTQFISPFEDIKECFQISFLHVSGDDGICSECFIVIRFINSMKSNMFSALKNEKCTVITIFNQYKKSLYSIQFQNNEHLEEMYATVCTETQPDQYKETRRARTPASGEVYGILKKNKAAPKRKRVNPNMGRSSVNNVRTASRASSTSSISSFTSRRLRSEPVYDPDRCNLESRIGFDDFDKENVDDDDDDDGVVVKRYRCQECSLYFASKLKLLQHTAKHSFDIYCPLCETEMNNVKLQEHLDYHQMVSIPCGFCEMSFVNYEKMSKHREKAHKNKVILLPPRITMNVVFSRSLRYANKNPKEVASDEPKKPFERRLDANEDGNHCEIFKHHDTYCLCMNNYLENDHVKMHDTYCKCKEVQPQSPRSDVDDFEVGTSIIYRQRDSDSSDQEIVDSCVPSTSTAPIPPPRIQDSNLTEDSNPIQDSNPTEDSNPIQDSNPTEDSNHIQDSNPTEDSDPIQDPKPFHVQNLTEMRDPTPPPIQNQPSPILESLPSMSSAPIPFASADRPISPMRGFSPTRNATSPPVFEASPPMENPSPAYSVKQASPMKKSDPLPPQLSVAARKNNGGIMPMDKASIYKQFIHDDSGKMNGCSDNEEIKRVTRSTGKQSCSEDDAIPSTSKQYYEQSRHSPVNKPKNQPKKTYKGNVKSKSPTNESRLLVVEVIKPAPNGETSELQEDAIECPKMIVDEFPKNVRKVIVEESLKNDEKVIVEESLKNDEKVIVEESLKNDEIMTKDGEFMMDSQEVIQYEDIGTVEEIIEEVIESNWQDQVKDWGGEESPEKVGSVAKKRSFFDTFINSEQQQCATTKKSVYDTFICRGNSKSKRGAKTSPKAKIAPILDNVEVYVVNPNSPGASRETEEIAVPSTTQIDSLPGTSDLVKKSRNREKLLKLMDDLEKKQKTMSSTSQSKSKTSPVSCTSASSSTTTSTTTVLPMSPPISSEKKESGEFLEKVAIALNSPIRKNKRKPNRPMLKTVAVTKRLGMSNVVRYVNNPPTSSSELVQVEGEIYTKNAYKHAKKKVKR